MLQNVARQPAPSLGRRTGNELFNRDTKSPKKDNAYNSHPMPIPPKTVVITETLDAHCADWLQAQLPPGSRVIWAKAEDAAPLDHLLPLADALVVRTYTQVNA